MVRGGIHGFLSYGLHVISACMALRIRHWAQSPVTA
ncbi:hypothetical protein ALO40_102862 [Pseudomonas syringae pv. viburni]|uniref:Lipoprotein n=1 Tax=Pseudomonas syringae pv. viburni TaxID=251703 RepID=A0A0Q0GWL9_9PSED|nr:hypothetical protein ALO40_102862 [Pseudomonas syringae pv. viburni]